MNRQSGYRVNISVRTVGQRFGHEGVLTDVRTGDVVATTATVPYGMEHVARQRAEDLAEQRGDIVTTDPVARANR